MNKIFAGIGSRECPFDIQLLMTDIAIFLCSKGWTLRSGGAIGADTAFENGCDEVKGKKEIFLPEDCTNEAIEFTKRYHPNWKAVLKYPGADKKHGRNAMIVLGRNLDAPASRVIGWCKEDEEGNYSGGTGQGFRIADGNKIRAYNLFHEEIRKKFYDLIYWGGKVKR